MSSDDEDDDYLKQLEEQKKEIYTRRGYTVKDLVRNLLMNISDQGPLSAGRSLHYMADLICSGGLPIFHKLCFDYAFDHIGLASPRIFVYLIRRFKELFELSSKLPGEAFNYHLEVQKITVEIVLILQNCPKRPKIKIPSVPVETHNNEQWLRSSLKASDKQAVKKVWDHSSDLVPLLNAGNEIIAACQEGAIEKALFWVKWLMEEDTIMKKLYGSGLSTQERGPPALPPKQRTSVGFFIICILAEMYKELAQRNLIRMHEEFQCLLDMYRSTDNRATQKRKMDCISLMILIVSEVPKWKVPAAPTLVKEVETITKAVGQANVFFKEILEFPPLDVPLPPKISGLTVHKKKKLEDGKKHKLDQQLGGLDKFTKDMLNL
jgi:hypothetical protein